MAKTPSAKLGVKHLIGYGAGDCGGVITLVGIGLMNRFILNVLKVDNEILAAMLLVWNIWDAVNDPMVGTFMDMAFAKSKNKTNKFRPWILRSIPVMAFGLIAFFTVPSMLEGFMQIAALFVLKIVYELGYTLMNIGMGSLLGVMATNDSERATLSSARGFGSTIGGMMGSMIAPQILKNIGETSLGYGIAATTCAILGCLIVFIHYAWTEERNVVAQSAVKEDAAEDKVKITDILNVFKVNRSYLALCIHSVCICMVQGISQNATAYMYADVLGDIGLQSFTTIISTSTMVVALSAAPLLAKKFDLVLIIRTALLAGIALFAGLYAYAMLVPVMNGWVYLIWSGLATALVTLSVQMQWGLVGESIDYNEYLTGKRSEGAIYGTFSLTRRIGQTIASSLAVLMIGWFGYIEGAGTAQPESAINGIKMMCILFPAVGGIGSWAAFTFVWDINKDIRAKMADWKAAKTAK